MTTSLTTIKVDKAVRDQLADVARSRHTTMRALLADVADGLAHEQEWAEIEAGYARLKERPDEWAGYLEELDGWEAGSTDHDDQATAEFPEYQQ